MSYLNNNGLFDLIERDVARSLNWACNQLEERDKLPKVSVVKTRKCSYCYTSNIVVGHNCPNCGANR